MAKLKNIIKQLSDNDFQTIYDSLMESSADKSAYLLKSMREKQMSDNAIMDELGVNTNAYYTLRSRLNQKIEEYLLQQMESPRTDILKKVANINEVIFTKKKGIAIATLKKLEKELIDYDLSNELTVVYKWLKKLHIHTPENFNYSQQYNRYVAYMLAVDKAEDLLADYFRKYGNFLLSGEDTDKLGLQLLVKEMSNVSALYDSHRLYVYQSCMTVFHRLFVETAESYDEEVEALEDILDKVQEIFSNYSIDSTYFHLKIVFEFLTLEYYNHYRVYRKAESYFEEVNEDTSNLLMNYGLYTFPPQFLFTKIARHLRLGKETQMWEENEALFQDFEVDTSDVPLFVSYYLYRSLSCYYIEKYDEAAQWLNNLLNEISLKKYPITQMEIKTLLALQYCLMRDFELFSQLINSIQRQVRILGKENFEHISILIKMMKTSLSDSKKDKYQKIELLAEKLKLVKNDNFAPTKFIEMSDTFIKALSADFF